MKLYGYWRSTAAYRVRIALHYKSIDFENISVHLVKDGGEQHAAEYRELNPQGLVPTLVDGDNRINQSLAILEYLEDMFPRNALLPSEPARKAQVRAVCQMIACDIHPLNNLRVLQYLTNEWNLDVQDKDAWYAHWIHQGFSALEKQLKAYAADGDYCFGEKVTLADLCLIPQIYNANRFNVLLDDYPRLQAINEACLQHPAFQKALPENQPDATA